MVGAQFFDPRTQRGIQPEVVDDGRAEFERNPAYVFQSLGGKLAQLTGALADLLQTPRFLQHLDPRQQPGQVLRRFVVQFAGHSCTLLFVSAQDILRQPLQFLGTLFECGEHMIEGVGQLVELFIAECADVNARAEMPLLHLGQRFLKPVEGRERERYRD